MRNELAFLTKWIWKIYGPPAKGEIFFAVISAVYGWAGAKDTISAFLIAVAVFVGLNLLFTALFALIACDFKTERKLFFSGLE
jgi:hypothetical protein